MGKSLFTAMQATRRAIDERFGKEPGAKPPVDFKQLEKEGAAIFGQTGLVGKEVKGDNKVVLKVKGTPWPPDGTDEYIAVKEADGWKLKSPEGIDLKKFEHKKAFFEAQKQVCVWITKEVKEGKYETRREAERAMAEALARVAKEYL